MRVLLIAPPYAASEPPRIPMGLLYLGAVLEEAGHDVEVLDLLVSKPTPERIRSAIEGFDPSLVGSTSVTMNYPEASAILRYVKELNPSVKTIVGGPHATFCWGQIGREEPWVDMLAIGEAEDTLRELVEVLDRDGDLSSIAGIAWRNGAEAGMTRNPDREFIRDLDALPMPARHLFPLSRYRALRMDAGLSSGRGCPFSCIFCVGPKMVGRRTRVRSAQSVADELEEIVKMGFQSVAISDDHFAMNRKHAFEVCDEIIGRGIEVELSIFVRADSVDPEILSRMYAAGCRKVLFGVESGVQEIVDRIKKRQNLEMVREKVALTKSMGIDVQASFILGLPGEGPETIRQTFEYAKSLETFFGMHILAPLPGSEIFEHAADYGITIHHREWSRYDANRAITSTETLPAEELDRIAAEYDDIFERLGKWEMDNLERGLLTPSDRKRIERRRAQAFFWKLLREGTIEEFRPRSAACDAELALRELSTQAARLTGVKEDEAFGWLGDVFGSDDIVWNASDAGGRFSFSSSIYRKAAER